MRPGAYPDSAFPFAHFNYDEVDIFCQCPLCRSYFTAVMDFAFVLSVTEGHRWHCRCRLCDDKRTIHRTSLTAGSRRDLFSELSFLTHEHPFSRQFLSWVLAKIQDDRLKGTALRTDSWWANHSPKKPLSAWMTEWQRAYLSPALIAVSGLI